MIATVELVDNETEASLGLFDFLRVPMVSEEIVIEEHTYMVDAVAHFTGGRGNGLGARVRVYVVKLEPF